MIYPSVHAVLRKSGTWSRLGKVTTVFVFLFLLSGGCSSPLHAEDDNILSTFPISGSFRLAGEGDKIGMRTTLLNPSNYLMRPDQHADGFLIGNATLKGLGGQVESELRLGYGYFAGTDSPSFDKHETYVNINQLYYQTANGPFSLMFGRKKVRWGVGYSYSPTDLITQLKNPEDPEDRLNKIKGSDIIQLSYINSNDEVDLVYYPILNWDSGHHFINANRIGMRWYNLIDPFDLAFVGIVDEYNKWSAGVNSAVTIGKSLELHAEYLYTSLNNTNYPNPYLDPAEIYSPFFLPHTVKGANDLLVGGQATFYGDWNLTLEYIYHGTGYSDDEYHAYVDRLSSLNSMLYTYYNQMPVMAGLKETALNFTTPIRQHYVFTRLYHPHLVNSISVEAYSFVGLADKSGLFVFMPKYTGSSSYEVYCRLEKFWGKSDSEFGLVPERLSGIVGLSLFLGK